MAVPLVKFGAAISLGSIPNSVLEFVPPSTAVWKSTMVSAVSIFAQPTTIGGGVGQNLGLAQLQVSRSTVCEFRILETYYGIAGGAVLVIPFGDGLIFHNQEAVRWLFDSTGAGGSGTQRVAATFFGVLP